MRDPSLPQLSTFSSPEALELPSDLTLLIRLSLALTMASFPDLSLPETVPGMRQYHDSESTTFPLALYTLYDANEKDIAKLQ